MLKIYDKNHNAIGHIEKYKDLSIESDVATGDRTLSFTYMAKHHTVEPEFYVETPDDEYVIKEKNITTDGFLQFTAALNLEELEGKAWKTFSIKDSTIDEGARLALAGTGWRVGECTVTKKRNAGMMKVTSLDVINKLCTAFMCERVYNTKEKTVSFYEKIGQDKGVYFMRRMNLRRLSKKSDSYDFYTQIIPFGSDGLTIESVNDGKDYLENHQYSDKVKSYIWVDESYTDAQALKDDAETKLEDMSKPYVSYEADIIDLARQKAGYSVLSFDAGDTITLIDAETGIKEKQRIVKLTRYPDMTDKDSCELANTTLTFEEIQQKQQEATEIINSVVAGDGRYTGTIKVSDILHFEEGLSGSSTIGGIQGSISALQGDLSQVKLIVGELDANYIRIEDADLKYATIEQLNVTNETVHSIEGDYASFKSTVTDEFSAHAALIDNVSGEFSSYKTQMAQELIAAKGWMAEGSIGDAQISSVDANKIRSGTIDTTIVTVSGSDGRLQISDNTMQISDANRVRVQVGKDESGDYTLAVWDASGNLIWDALGATENTIQRKIIRDEMVSDDAAIQAKKIDFQSFNTAMTDQGVIISGTVVQAGDKTLTVALTEQNQLISEQGETLIDHAARITANENSIRLKVSEQEYESYKSYVNGEISSTESRLSTAESGIAALNGQISLKVEQVDIDTAVQKIEDKLSEYSTTAQINSAIEIAKDSIETSVSETYATTTALEETNGKITSLESWKTEASQKITKDGIIATVGNYYAYESDLEGAEQKLSSLETKATQTEEKFNWIVKSGTSETDFTLTDRTATLVADAINLKGLVKFSGLDNETQTQINAASDMANSAASNADMANARATYHYGTCSTSAETAEKEVELNGFELYTGAIVNVKFVYANVAGYPTLNVNGTGAKEISVYGAVLSEISPYNWMADSTVSFTYNGTQWVMTDTSAMQAMANWCYSNDITYINGGKIYAGTVAASQIAANAVTADKIATDAIQSRNYYYSSGYYSVSGTFLDLSNGVFRSKYFGMDIFLPWLDTSPT